MKPFKIQHVQELKLNDLPQRSIFGEWALGKLADDALFYRKIVFSDKAHFWLNGCVNKHNFRFWSEDQPEELQKRSQFGAVYGLVASLNRTSSKMLRMVNGERYRMMISNLFFDQKSKSLTSMTCGFNKTVPDATQHA